MEFKLRISSADANCEVVFEPIGDALSLTAEDCLTVEFEGGAPADVDITRTQTGISIWPSRHFNRVRNRDGRILLDNQPDRRGRT